MQVGNQVYRRTDRLAGRQPDRQTGKQADGQIGRQTDRQADGQTGRQMMSVGSQVDRPTDRQVGRQIDTKLFELELLTVTDQALTVFFRFVCLLQGTYFTHLNLTHTHLAVFARAVLPAMLLGQLQMCGFIYIKAIEQYWCCTVYFSIQISFKGTASCGRHCNGRTLSLGKAVAYVGQRTL